MPLVINLDFKLTALRSNGTGIAGARIRILAPNGSDVTAQLFGTPDLFTDSLGVYQGRVTGEAGPALFAEQATIQVTAQYYDVWQYQTPFIALGITHLTANLTRTAITNNYTVTAPDNDFVSSMAPVVCQVESESTYAWEYIQARVQKPDGSNSPIQAPVDKTTHQATLDIRNRLNLGVRPYLVKEPAVNRADTDFSTKVSVSLSSITDEGENSLGLSFSVSAAATLPPDGETDLSSYVSLDRQPWLVPSLPVIAFRGYYRDVMVWLPVPSLPGYVLTRKYYNHAGTLVSTTTDNLTESPYVQRIRLNTNPADGVARCVLSITSGSDEITQHLTVLYRD